MKIKGYLIFFLTIIITIIVVVIPLKEKYKSLFSQENSIIIQSWIFEYNNNNNTFIKNIIDFKNVINMHRDDLKVIDYITSENDISYVITRKEIKVYKSFNLLSNTLMYFLGTDKNESKINSNTFLLFKVRNDIPMNEKDEIIEKDKLLINYYTCIYKSKIDSLIKKTEVNFTTTHNNNYFSSKSLFIQFRFDTLNGNLTHTSECSLNYLEELFILQLKENFLSVFKENRITFLRKNILLPEYSSIPPPPRNIPPKEFIDKYNN